MSFDLTSKLSSQNPPEKSRTKKSPKSVLGLRSYKQNCIDISEAPLDSEMQLAEEKRYVHILYVGENPQIGHLS
jgi:hypothetical protein